MPHPYLTDALRALAAEVVRDAVTPAVAAALGAALPEVLRRAALPVYLTKKELGALTGWSPRKIDYMLAGRRLSAIRRGRTVLFKTADIEAYLHEGYVPAINAERGGEPS